MGAPIRRRLGLLGRRGVILLGLLIDILLNTVTDVNGDTLGE